MRRKIALIMAFTLIFSIVFNMNSGISVTVNALSGGPRLIDSNIRDGDEDVSVHKTFVLTFNIKIEIDANKKPNMNPPVCPNNTPKPLLPPANTGKPLAPNNINAIMHMALCTGLKIKAIRLTAIVCPVIIMGVKGKGITI
jgi:hypothetical protein